jgi:hypothetical protein
MVDSVYTLRLSKRDKTQIKTRLIYINLVAGFNEVAFGSKKRSKFEIVRKRDASNSDSRVLGWQSHPHPIQCSC